MKLTKSNIKRQVTRKKNKAVNTLVGWLIVLAFILWVLDLI